MRAWLRVEGRGLVLVIGHTRGSSGSSGSGSGSGSIRVFNRENMLPSIRGANCGHGKLWKRCLSRPNGLGVRSRGVRWGQYENQGRHTPVCARGCEWKGAGSCS